MRIAILTNAFPPDGLGGAERIAFVQADGFSVSGHEVRVFAPGTGREWSSNTVQGVEAERFPSKFSRLAQINALSRFFYHSCSDLRTRRDVAERILAWKPDALLTHNLTGCGLGTARIVQQAGIRWIHTLHDIQLTDPSGQETAAQSKTLTAKAWRSVWSAWRRNSFGTPDVVVSATQWLLDWHTRHGFLARRAIILPNPVELPVARERSPQLPAVIAYVGRLTTDKGFDLFLEALSHLDTTLVGRAIVVGEGPLGAEAADPRLELRGRLPPEDAQRAIAEADLLIAPSRILENQQTILLEAMVEGTPAIATDTGGTKETLEGTGCPVAPPGADAAAHIEKNVRRLLENADEWRRVSREMRSRSERHDTERYFNSLSDLLSG